MEKDRTDSEHSTPERLKGQAKALAKDDFLSTFQQDEMKFILKAFQFATLDDLILLIKWNPIWLGVPGNLVVRNNVLHHITTNGGADPRVSGFVFHFQTGQALEACRESLKVAVPQAFHPSPVTIAHINQQFGLDLPAPVPMAEAWVILKTAVLATDYRQDHNFFLE